MANITHSFTPSLITEFRAGYNRYDTKINGSGGSLGPALGFGSGLPNVSIPGMMSFGSPLTTPMHGIDNNFNFAWDWSYRTSRNNIKAGVDIRRFRSDGFYGGLTYNTAGAAYFGPGATLSPTVGGFSPAGNFANSFASFLVGAPSTTGAAAFTEAPTIRQSWYGLHLSDNVQLARRLSVDVGVRWDVFSPLEPRRTGGAMFYDPAIQYAELRGPGWNRHAHAAVRPE